MLTPDITSKINNFVSQQPRTIQDIAQLLGKNWRTAETYVQRISLEQGMLAIKVFREGTRGALKIVYWNAVDKHHSSFQEALFQKIVSARDKKDFSPFDIYQYVNKESRKCFIEKQENNINIKQDLIRSLCSAQQQVLIFSGDVSWAVTRQGKTPLFRAFEELAKRRISVKMLATIDLNSSANVQKMLSLNHKYGEELIEIRHCQQPLRAFIVDNVFARFKEKYFLHESSADNYLFYSITNPDWINWLQKVFWHIFSISPAAEKRIADLNTIRKL
jgi:hypothetical protein